MGDCRFELTELVETCSEQIDRGHKECAEWHEERRKKCKSWGIFSFLCEAFEWVVRVTCEAWQYVTFIVCVLVLVTTCLLPDDLKPWIIRSKLGRAVGSVPNRRAKAFNISTVDDQFLYNDSGRYYEYRIDTNGIVQYRLFGEDRTTSPSWVTLVPDPKYYDGQAPHSPKFVSYTRSRGEGNRRKLHEDHFDMEPQPKFDMIAAGENRIFAKEEGRDNFFIACIVEDFRHFRRSSTQDPVSVPGFYAKLDPECFKPGAVYENLVLIKPSDYYDHPSLDNFILYNIARKLTRDTPFGLLRDALNIVSLGPLSVGLSFLLHLFEPDLMLVRFVPGIWHELDSRPPQSSGSVPHGVRAYGHVTFGWIVPLVNLEILLPPTKSIEFTQVLGMGVGRLHRHTHYDTIHGGELHVMPFNAGPAGDFASFYDGTCNYFILCKLSRTKYGLLWIDEQTYYSERWRLVHPDDDDWNPIRGIAAYSGPGLLPYQGPDAHLHFKLWDPYEDPMLFGGPLKESLFWCPFKTGYIRSWSRLAVARQTIIVCGQAPDHDPEGENGKLLLFSLVFSWGSLDRTWRWRDLPAESIPHVLDEAKEQRLRNDEDEPVDFYPDEDAASFCQLIDLRDDMTICVRGYKKIASDKRDGHWYQKYLPADNWERPTYPDDVNIVQGRRPRTGYNHEWQFMPKEAFRYADRYSHFGVYEDPIDSRSQYYEIDIVESRSELTKQQLAECPEDTQWLDVNSVLHVPNLRINYAALEDVLFPADPLHPQSVELIKGIAPPPSLFNPHTWLRIVNRPTKDEPDRPRFIAMLWDKRDDDFHKLEPFLPLISEEVTLRAVGLHTGSAVTHARGDSVTIKLRKRTVLWKPPIVQRASLSISTSRKLVELSFWSEIEEMPRYLHHWRRIQAHRWLGLDVPLYATTDPSEVDPYDPVGYPCPDITIFGVKLNLLEEGHPAVLHEWTIHDFSGTFSRGRHDFMAEWRDAQMERGWDQVVDFLTEPKNFDCGVNVVFEDLVGHVTIPQVTHFTIGGCRLDPSPIWDMSAQKFTASINAGQEIAIKNLSPVNRMIQITGHTLDNGDQSAILQGNSGANPAQARVPTTGVPSGTRIIVTMLRGDSSTAERDAEVEYMVS